MKTILISIFLTAFSLSSFSQNSGIGIGVIVGEPTGLTAKMWTSRTTAVDAAAAWSMVGNGYVHLHADALVHSFAVKINRGKLPLYMGLGGRVLLADRPAVGIRVPFGLAYHFYSIPLEIFFEWAPILDLLPATEINYNWAVGIRYYL